MTRKEGHRHKPYTYRQARRYVAACSKCWRQFVILTKDGSINAICPHCGHRETREPPLPPGDPRRA